MVKKILKLAQREGITTQDAFEREFGLPRGRVSKWLNGQGKPTWDQVVTWCRRLKIPLASLNDEDDDNEAADQEPFRITDEEQYIVEYVRNLGLSRQEVTQALLSSYARLHRRETPPQTGFTAPQGTEYLPSARADSKVKMGSRNQKA